MVMFSIIQLGFTRFLTDRKEWIYLPPLRYICVCGGGGGTRHRGECSRFLAAILDFVAQKKCNAPPPYAHRPGSPRPQICPDWVHEWVQQSGLMPICPDNQAHLRREVVGLLPHASISEVSTPSHLTVNSVLLSVSTLVE